MNWPLILSCIVLVFIPSSISHQSTGANDVVIRVNYEINGSHKININFNWSMFLQFYGCMCSKQNITCTAKYSAENYKVIAIYNQSYTWIGSQNNCGVFTCSNSGQQTSLVCFRSRQFIQQSCPKAIYPIFVHVKNASSCNMNCIGFSFLTESDNLTINKLQSQYEHCDNDCCDGVTTSSLPSNRQSAKATTISTTRIHQSKTSTQGISQSTEPNNSSAITTAQSENTFLETIIISSVAAGLILIAFITFVIIFILRRKHYLTKSKRNVSSNITANQDAFNQHREAVNKNPQRWNLFHNNNNNKSNAKDDHKINADSSRQDHKYLDHKTSEDINRSSAVLRTEYSVIDESLMQRDSRFNPNNVTPNDLTNTTTINDITNDGYTRINDFGYYNVVTPGVYSLANNGNTKSYEHKELGYTRDIQDGYDRAKNTSIDSAYSNTTDASRLVSPANDLSNYSLAKCIDESVDDERDNKLDNLPEVVTKRQDGVVRERANRLTLKSLHEIEGGANVNIANETNGHTYFVLSKEDVDK